MTQKAITWDVGFADSEFVCYSKMDDIFIVTLRLWNETIVEVKFSDTLGVIDKGCFGISEITAGIVDSDDARQFLTRMFETRLDDHSYLHFQFLDTDDVPCIEVIAKSYCIIKK